MCMHKIYRLHHSKSGCSLTLSQGGVKKNIYMMYFHACGINTIALIIGLYFATYGASCLFVVTKCSFEIRITILVSTRYFILFNDSILLT